MFSKYLSVALSNTKLAVIYTVYTKENKKNSLFLDNL